MGGSHQLNTALGDCSSRHGFSLGADLVDHDHFGHVVLNRLDHDLVLVGRGNHLHAPGSSDSGMGNVAVARDFVRSVHDHHALTHLIRQDSGNLAQLGGFAHAGSAEQQNRSAGAHNVVDDVDRPFQRSPNPAGKANDLAMAVADAAYAVKGSLDAGPVIRAELAYRFNHIIDILLGDYDLFVPFDPLHKAGLGGSAVVQNNFDEPLERSASFKSFSNYCRQDVQELG